MADAVQIASIDLKCDVEDCDHVEQIERMSEDLVGKPCPKCGANLLTEDDLKSALMIEAFASFANSLVGPVDPSGHAIPVSINPHAGDWNIKVKAAERG